MLRLRRRGRGAAMSDYLDKPLRSEAEAMADRQEPNELERELFKALEEMRPMAGMPHDFTVAQVWAAQEKADAALARYKKERAT